MRLAFWRKRQAAPVPATPPAEPKEMNCRYCGPVLADPEQHLASPEHRLAQAMALSPTLGEPDGDDPAFQ